MEINAQNTPDLVPILAVLATSAEGTTVIRNAQRLRAKESDRLAAMTDVLRRLGANITETEDGLLIQGEALTGGDVSSWGDHRIAMAAAIAATICSEPVIIRGAEAVNKSYPHFFNDLREIGGSVTIIG
jgi:3-phosphoshikimate 1-carboxyvinyltransferase